MEILGKGLKPGMPGASGGAAYMTGMREVMANLNVQIAMIKGATEKGFVEVAAFIRNKTEHEEPLTPVDLGNLRASWFVVSAKKVYQTKGPSTFSGKDAGKISGQKDIAITESQGQLAGLGENKIGLMMGYGANYAGFVHEFIPGIANFQRPGSREKWLQSHLYTNTGKIVEIVKENVKIK